MGIEQATPVVGSIAELSSIIDLPDLRLPRVFRAWTDFINSHHQQIATLGSLSVGVVVGLAGELSNSISQVLGIGVGDETVSEQKVAQLADAVSGEGNRVIFMRHGEQNPPDWIDSIPDPKLRKIRMMQDPFNREDLLTDRGLQDVFVTAFSLFYITRVTGRRVQIFSSENTRARKVAEIVEVTIPDSTFATHEGLNCITYKDETDQPPIMAGELLKVLPLGTMPWEPELVDRWCKTTRSGVEPSRAITEEIEGLVNMGTGPGNDLILVLTHTQQLAEVLRQRGELDDSSIRVPGLTMIALTEDSTHIIKHPLLILKI